MAETPRVIATIRAILSTTDEIAYIYKTIEYFNGLPKAFSVVAHLLPIVRATLESAIWWTYQIKDADVVEKIYHIGLNCQSKINALKIMLEGVGPRFSILLGERYAEADSATVEVTELESLSLSQPLFVMTFLLK